MKPLLSDACPCGWRLPHLVVTVPEGETVRFALEMSCPECGLPMDVDARPEQEILS